MQFQTLGHACLWVRAAQKTFLVDPWLWGSCYWRGWWHFPPAAEPPEPVPDYIYISHHHFDHCHYPSLRRLGRRAGDHITVLIPEFAVDFMAAEMRTLGFERIVELPHGAIHCPSEGIRLASYQFGFDDSALVLEAEGVVLVDLNDCKINGAAAQAMLRDFGRPTFAFKSHSFASAFPNCYEFDDPSDDNISLTADDYCATFVHSAQELNPEYAVPFASMVGFLHPENVQCNAHVVTPPTVCEAARRAGHRAEVMVPGDGWDSQSGFRLGETRFYDDLDRHMQALDAEVRPRIEVSLAEEAQVALSFPPFEAHLGGLLRKLPPGAKYLLPRPVVFEVPSDTEKPYWVLDAKAGRVYRSADLPDRWASLIRASESVLADAIEKKVLNFLHISMRVRIRIAPGGASTDLAFWGFMVLYEMGYLPLLDVVRPRALRVLWRRRAEIVQTIVQGLRGVMSGRGVAGGMIDNLVTRDESKETT